MKNNNVPTYTVQDLINKHRKCTYTIIWYNTVVPMKNNAQIGNSKHILYNISITLKC